MTAETIRKPVVRCLVPSQATRTACSRSNRHFPYGLSRETLPARNASYFNIAPPLCRTCGNFLPGFRLRTRPKSRPGSQPERFPASISGSAQTFSVGVPRFSPLEPLKSHAPSMINGGGSASRAMRSRIAANKFRVTATSASWKNTDLACRVTFAPILMSFSRSVVSDQ
jgi:hypothetical protein